MNQHFLTHSITRISLALLFLVVVNVGSGVLAVDLGYPSLWGAAEVFSEYAYPALYNWALMHVVSMAPLAYLIYRLPTLQLSKVRLCQGCIVAALVVLFFVEVKLPHGTLRHIPFALFLIVDALTFLILALILRPPRMLIPVGGLLGALLILLFTKSYYEHEQLRVEKIEAPQTSRPDFFSNVTKHPRRDGIDYVAIVNEQVGPNLGPDKERICEEAKIIVSPKSRDLVIFRVYPWFEPERAHVYYAGEATYDEAGVWQCQFQLPEPD